jgi:hypothetical protein
MEAKMRFCDMIIDISLHIPVVRNALSDAR